MVPDDLIQHALRRLARTIAVGGSGHARHKREAHATPDGRRDPRNLRHDALFCRSPCLGILGGRSQNFQCLRRPPWAPRCETHEDATWPRLAPRPSVADPSLGESLASEAEVDGVRIGVICEYMNKKLLSQAHEQSIDIVERPAGQSPLPRRDHRRSGRRGCAVPTLYRSLRARAVPRRWSDRSRPGALWTSTSSAVRSMSRCCSGLRQRTKATRHRATWPLGPF